MLQPIFRNSTNLCFALLFLVFSDIAHIAFAHEITRLTSANQQFSILISLQCGVYVNCFFARYMKICSALGNSKQPYTHMYIESASPLPQNSKVRYSTGPMQVYCRQLFTSSDKRKTRMLYEHISEYFFCTKAF